MLKKLGRDAVIYGGADFLFKAISFAILPVYVRFFSVADFGVMSMLSVTVGLIGMLANMGVTQSIQRFYWDQETRHEERSVLVSTGLVQLVSLGVIALLIILVPAYLEQQQMLARYGIDWQLALLALFTIIPDQIVQYVLDTIRLHFSPIKFFLISFSKNLLGVLIGLWLIIVSQKGLYGYFEGMLLASTATVPLALWFIRKELVLQVDLPMLRKIFAYGHPFVFAGMAYWIFGSMDRWMLAELGNTREVGLYSVAFKVSTLIGFVTAAFSQAWSPYVVKMMSEDKEYRKSFSRVFSLWYFILAMIGLLISLFAREILMLLTPRVYWDASGVLSAVTMGLVLQGTTQITAIGISLESRTRLLTHIAWLTACVNFGLNYILIPRFGAEGSAWATLVSYAMLTSIFLFWTQRLHPIPLERKKLLYSTFLVAAGLLSPLSNSWNWYYSPIAKFALLILLVKGAHTMGIINVNALRQLLGKKKNA